MSPDKTLSSYSLNWQVQRVPFSGDSAFVFPHLTELLSFPVHGLDPILFHTISARHDISLFAKAAPDFVP